MFQVRDADGRLVTFDVPAKRRHMLDFSGPTPAPQGAAPDLVIVPVHKLATDIQTFAALPDAMFDPVRAGRAKLLLDASCEGVPANQPLPESKIWRVELHREMERRGLDSGRASYLTNDRNFATDYLAPTLTEGRAPMAVHVHDYYIRALFKPFETTGEAHFAHRQAAWRARPLQRGRRFICLNFTVRESKVLLLMRLVQAGLWEQGHISFSGFDREVNPRAPRQADVERWLRVYPGFEDLFAELKPYLSVLGSKGMTMLGKTHRSDNTGRFKGVTDEARIWEYNDAWFSLVTETELWGPHRITEKPFKAMMNFSPAITLGAEGNLRLARKYGFRTFPELFDESYDEMKDPRARFEAVWSEVERLCRMPETELARLEARTHETLEYNARRAFLEMPAAFKNSDLRLLSAVMNDMSASPRPASATFSLSRFFSRWRPKTLAEKLPLWRTEPRSSGDGKALCATAGGRHYLIEI